MADALTIEPKLCLYCNESLVLRIRESQSKFLKRKYCNIYCKNKDIARILWADESHRAKMLHPVISPEMRLHKSEIMRRQWTDGTMQAYHIANKRRNTPNWKGLSDDDIRKIITDPRKYEDIGNDYEIAITTVSAIKLGKRHQIENRPKPVIIRSGKTRRISNDDIQSIIEDPEPHPIIAKKYNISKSYVSKIKRGKIILNPRGLPTQTTDE